MGNCAGIDWASEKHDVLIADGAGDRLFAETFAHDEQGVGAVGGLTRGDRVDSAWCARRGMCRSPPLEGLLVEPNATARLGAVFQ